MGAQSAVNIPSAIPFWEVIMPSPYSFFFLYLLIKKILLLWIWLSKINLFFLQPIFFVTIFRFLFTFFELSPDPGPQFKLL